MLFSANHGITDSLSFICCIDHEPNTAKLVAEAVVVLHGSTLSQTLHVSGGSILPLLRTVSALLSALPHSGLQGSAALVTSNSHCWSVARIRSV